MAGEYQIKLQGVDAGGDYKLFSGIINDENISQNQEFLTQSAIFAGTVDTFSFNYQPDAPKPVSFESEVDFNKMIELTKVLYSAKEIKKKSVYQYLVNNFESLQKQTEKFGRLKNKNISRILARFVELRLRLMLKELNFYLKKDWISAKANEIIKSNINLLINKL